MALSNIHPTENYCKISVDSYEDILYLKKELKRYLTTEIPIICSNIKDFEGEIEVTSRIEHWIDQLFQHAGSNISINGQDYEGLGEMKDAYEHVDQKLQADVTALEKEYAEILCEVVKKRTEYPKQLSLLALDVINAKSDLLSVFMDKVIDSVTFPAIEPYVRNEERERMAIEDFEDLIRNKQ